MTVVYVWTCVCLWHVFFIKCSPNVSSLMFLIAQVDFVGHHPNPKFVRGAPYGQATAAVSKLRNTRVAMISIKPPPLAAMKQEKKKRAGVCVCVASRMSCNYDQIV